MTDARSARRPRIAITVAAPQRQRDPELALRKNELYADAIARHEGVPVLIDATCSRAERAGVLESMEGLVLSGGPDVHPARYGQPLLGAHDIEDDRDRLEAEAWERAAAAGLPVFGICRGLQAINVFMGGRLVQHVDGHAGPPWGQGPALRHELRLVPGTRLSAILSAGDGATLDVNSYHHQGVRIDDVGPGLIPSAWAPSEGGELVEGIEVPGRFVVAVQSHPERTESTPEAFERLWAAFVDAARGW